MKRVLSTYHSHTLDSLARYIPNREPRKHLYDLVPLYPRRGGKGFRPALCMATCQAFGGIARDALLSATAIELFHNAFLVHDDVEDGSEDRRGEPTLHASHGVPIAVNVGDAMNVLSIRPLMDNLQLLGPEMTWRVLSEIEHMVRQSVEGQAMELGWVRDNDCTLTEPDYLRMVLKKTCWYTCIHPIRIGAMIAGVDVDIDRFNRFGYYLGAAFQIQDDLLNLVGDRRKYGKEIAGDIWEGKRTLMLIHLLRSCTAQESVLLRRFLQTPRAKREHGIVRWVSRLMNKYDCIEFGRVNARQLAGAALREFYALFSSLPHSEDKEFIENIVLYMIEREL